MAGDTKIVRIEMPRGADGQSFDDSVKGDQTVDYIVHARQGQHATVRLLTKHTATTFNVYAPGAGETPIFNGSESRTPFEAVLQVSGEYRVRVYLLPDAASRGDVARYKFQIFLEPAD